MTNRELNQNPNHDLPPESDHNINDAVLCLIFITYGAYYLVNHQAWSYCVPSFTAALYFLYRYAKGVNHHKLE